MADEEERVKAEKLAAAKKRVTTAHSGPTTRLQCGEVINIMLIQCFPNR